MRNDISPTCCLPFESEHAKSLHWLPLAVRHKLDGAGLRLTLEQWQALPLRRRVDLLHRLPASGFEIEAREAGATFNRSAGQTDIDEVDVASLLGCSLNDGRKWLIGASLFARYALGKRIGKRERSRGYEEVDVRPVSADGSAR